VKYRIEDSAAGDGVERVEVRATRGRPARYPLLDLAVGQSFAVHEDEVAALRRACKYVVRKRGIKLAWAYENPRWRVYRVG